MKINIELDFKMVICQTTIIAKHKPKPYYIYIVKEVSGNGFSITHPYG